MYDWWFLVGFCWTCVGAVGCLRFGFMVGAGRFVWFITLWVWLLTGWFGCVLCGLVWYYDWALFNKLYLVFVILVFSLFGGGLLCFLLFAINSVGIVTVIGN